MTLVTAPTPPATTPTLLPTLSPTLPPAPAPAPVSWARSITFAATLALIILGLAWELWLAPTGRGTLAVKVLPLVLVLPGLARHRMYTYRWLSLLAWLYVLEGLVRATSDQGLSALLAGFEVAVSVVMFIAATFYIRLRLANAAGMAPSTSA